MVDREKKPGKSFFVIFCPSPPPPRHSTTTSTSKTTILLQHAIPYNYYYYYTPPPATGRPPGRPHRRRHSLGHSGGKRARDGTSESAEWRARREARAHTHTHTHTQSERAREGETESEKNIFPFKFLIFPGIRVCARLHVEPTGCYATTVRQTGCDWTAARRDWSAAHCETAPRRHRIGRRRGVLHVEPRLVNVKKTVRAPLACWGFAGGPGPAERYW